ncbi:MAG: TylF/MycF/NovP-related O-methyltransferase [Chlamydiota bacterium]
MNKIKLFIIRAFSKVLKNVSHSLYPIYGSYRSTAEPLYFPWNSNEAFLSIYEKANSSSNRDRYYMIYCLSRQACLLQEGNFIEFGTHSGDSANFMAHILKNYDKENKSLTTIDSFEGFPATSQKEDLDVRTNKLFIYFEAGGLKSDYEQVKEKLKTHQPPVLIVKGFIPNVFQKLEEKQYCFAHIDVDLYQATFDSLSYVYEKMVPGGIILMDDYGFPMCPGARQAADNFFEDKPEIILPLPTGQAIVFKTLQIKKNDQLQKV